MARRVRKRRDIPAILTSSQDLAEKLTRRIFGQEFPTGAKLPSERELGDEYGVARNVVREAIKRLEAIGAVRSWRGSGVYVQDIEFVRGVDMFDTLITHEDGSINIDFLREVVEFSGSFTRFVVRLAAIHRSDEDLRSMRELVDEWQKHREDPRKLTELSNEIYRQFVHATHNRVCLGLFHTLERISVKLFSMVDATVLDFEQKRKAFNRLFEALEERDAMMAEAAVVHYQHALEDKLSSDVVTRGLFDGALFA